MFSSFSSHWLYSVCCLVFFHPDKSQNKSSRTDLQPIASPACVLSFQRSSKSRLQIEQELCIQTEIEPKLFRFAGHSSRAPVWNDQPDRSFKLLFRQVNWVMYTLTRRAPNIAKQETKPFYRFAIKCCLVALSADINDITETCK